MNGDIRITTYRRLDWACDAINILDRYNPLRNDLDAYLHEVAQWGLGRRLKPKPEDFGIEEV